MQEDQQHEGNWDTRLVISFTKSSSSGISCMFKRQSLWSGLHFCYFLLFFKRYLLNPSASFVTSKGFLVWCWRWLTLSLVFFIHCFHQWERKKFPSFVPLLKREIMLLFVSLPPLIPKSCSQSLAHSLWLTVSGSQSLAHSLWLAVSGSQFLVQSLWFTKNDIFRLEFPVLYVFMSRSVIFLSSKVNSIVNRVSLFNCPSFIHRSDCSSGWNLSLCWRKRTKREERRRKECTAVLILCWNLIPFLSFATV